MDESTFQVGDTVRIKATAFQPPAGEYLQELRGEHAVITQHDVNDKELPYGIKLQSGKGLWMREDEIESVNHD